METHQQADLVTQVPLLAPIYLSSAIIITVVILTGHVALATDVQLKQYSNGGIYEGEFLNGKQHGQGTSTHANVGKYEGEFKEGLKNGLGISSFIMYPVLLNGVSSNTNELL